jgi:hypothetical protein
MILSSAGQVSRAAFLTFSALATRNFSVAKTYRTIQTVVIHRHGDRSPITPLKDEDYWTRALVPPEVAKKIAQGTSLIQSDAPNTHKAAGRGPFGKLSELGLLQMVQVGATLRERFITPVSHTTTDKETILIQPLLEKHLEPRQIQVYCTDFERTIQSVQGLLIGLFPNSDLEQHEPVSIDTRLTQIMIPDPVPRQFPEQAVLEKQLAQRPFVLQREAQMAALATKATKALRPLLAVDAREMSFGVYQPSDTSIAEEIELQPLGWNQLAEISKCLQTRDMLPFDAEDADEIMKHAAWRWYQTLRDPRVVHLAMGRFADMIVTCLERDGGAPVTICSAHDSTLMGLSCAFRLEQPASWPDYASYMLLELVQDAEDEQRYVRFSLNGVQLNSDWGDRVCDMIPLEELAEKIRTIVGVETTI